MSDCNCALHRVGLHPLVPKYQRGDRVHAVMPNLDVEGVIERTYYDEWLHEVRVFVITPSHEHVLTAFTEKHIEKLPEAGDLVPMFDLGGTT